MAEWAASIFRLNWTLTEAEPCSGGKRRGPWKIIGGKLNEEFLVGPQSGLYGGAVGLRMGRPLYFPDLFGKYHSE